MGKRTWDGAHVRLGLVITAVVAVGAVFGPTHFRIQGKLDDNPVTYAASCAAQHVLLQLEEPTRGSPI